MGRKFVILLDTCAVIWDALERQSLSVKAVKAIDDADKFGALIMSDITIWEIAMLANKGRLKIDSTTSHFINLYMQTRNVSVVQISPEIAELSVNFDATINKDPADRIISATSVIHNAQLVTADQNLISSDSVNTLW